MKFRVVLRMIGTVLKLLAIMLVVPGIVAAIYRETSGVMAFALSAILSLITGIILGRIGPDDRIGNREAFAIVTIGWLAATFFGALPYFFQGLSFVDSLFESISGFTATGATILTESNPQGYYIINTTLADQSIASELVGTIHGHAITGLPYTYYGMLFWRSFQQLIGGLGIVLLIVAIFPELHVAGRQLFMAETVGPSKETLVPRAVSTARILWSVYLLFNAAEIVLLIAAGMPIYDAICNGFSTLATGGFSPQSSSLVAYHSVLIDTIVAIFMILGASSFTLHYRVLTSDRLAWFKDQEFRFFIFLLAAGSLILTFLGGIEGDFLTRFRFGAFQVISIMATCGFVNTLDYDKWTTAAKMTLIMVMLIGACIGSTGGGIKVGRLLVCLKYAYLELIRMIHPHAVATVKLGDQVVKEDVLRPILFYSFFYLATFFILSLALAMVEFQNSKVDLQVVASGVASCMGGVGPAFGIITFDWSQISPIGKMIGFFCMYIGRLELMPIFLLFTPELWRK